MVCWRSCHPCIVPSSRHILSVRVGGMRGSSRWLFCWHGCQIHTCCCARCTIARFCVVLVCCLLREPESSLSCQMVTMVTCLLTAVQFRRGVIMQLLPRGKSLYWHAVHHHKVGRTANQMHEADLSVQGSGLYVGSFSYVHGRNWRLISRVRVN